MDLIGAYRWVSVYELCWISSSYHALPQQMLIQYLAAMMGPPPLPAPGTAPQHWQLFPLHQR